MALSDAQREKLKARAAAEAAVKPASVVQGSVAGPKLINWKPFAIVGLILIVAAGVGLYFLGRNSTESVVPTTSVEETIGAPLTPAAPIVGQRGEPDMTLPVPTPPDTWADTNSSEDVGEVVSTGDGETIAGTTDVVVTEPQVPMVSVTVPEWLSGVKSQHDANVFASQNGFDYAAVNADGSVTYDMTRERREEMCKEQLASFDELLDSMTTRDHIAKATSDEFRMSIMMTVSEWSEDDDYRADVEALLRSSYWYGLYRGLARISPSVSFVDESGTELAYYDVADILNGSPSEPVSAGTEPEPSLEGSTEPSGELEGAGEGVREQMP